MSVKYSTADPDVDHDERSGEVSLENNAGSRRQERWQNFPNIYRT